METLDFYKKAYDVVVVGGGPSGCQTAIYTASEGIDTLIIEQERIGGQIRQTPRLENFAGQLDIPGPEFAGMLKDQALRMGATITYGKVVDITNHTYGKEITVESGSNLVKFLARAMVIATGASWNTLDVPGETLKNVFYGPSAAMTEKFHGETVAFIGGGNSAAQGILHVALQASRVHVFCRSGISSSQYLVDRMLSMHNVEIHEQVSIDSVIGTSEVTGIRVNGTTYKMDRVFVTAGLKPNTSFLNGIVDLDHNRYIKVGVHEGFNMMTSEPGIFATGDVRAGAFKALGTAIGDARVVTGELHRFLSSAMVPAVSL